MTALQDGQKEKLEKFAKTLVTKVKANIKKGDREFIGIPSQKRWKSVAPGGRENEFRFGRFVRTVEGNKTTRLTG